MAATLFASPPSASLPEAIQHFLQAERLKPDGWKENRLFLAKCYIGMTVDILRDGERLSFRRGEL